ncbi:hypothetical protein GCM10023091_17130 [Ravibacter arvi]|uniref:Gliding motility-associated-like protein n=1 Tax=Ravibacter arvi TaxID=2051041 RepID=A0ABP8LY85_9BACT
MKTPLLLFTMACFLLAIRVSGQVDLKEGLIGCYPFSGNANDLSGNANHGKVNGATLTEDRFGVPESAYNFNGLYNFIELDAGILQLNQFSYSLWVSPQKKPDPAAAMFLISVGSEYGDQHILLGDEYATPPLSGFAHGCYQGVGDNVKCTGIWPDLNKWYHLALTKSETSYLFFMNGKLVCERDISGKFAFYGTGKVKAVIGARNNYGQASRAVIDDVHLYNRALSEEEILALYHGEFETSSIKVNLKADQNDPCANQSLGLTATAEDAGQRSFVWKADGNILANEYGPEVSYLLPEKKTPYEITFSARALIKDQCFPVETPETSVTINVKHCSVPSEERNLPIIPDAFTPNNDGINDLWQVIISSKYRNPRTTVFNRWGEVIFQSNEHSVTWDGMYAGQPIPAGIYVTRIVSDGNIIREGQLVVLY